MTDTKGAATNGTATNDTATNGTATNGTATNGAETNGAATKDAGHQTDESYERGLAIRKEVLGAAHVERSLAGVSEFSRPVQELVTRSCWGDVWSCPGLDRRTRSLLNLGMLTALGRNHELAVHVRGALTNGCSETEIQEALLQTAVYCGAPAALESFRVAERVLGEVAAEREHG